MLIKEVCERCGLTKKAIEYYEMKNLINPQVSDNGYRDYSESDIAMLKEISVLRKCEISVADIKEILNSNHKAAALAKHKYVTEIKKQRLSTIQECLENLIEDYDVDREFNYLQAHDENFFTIKERFILAFPGDYGLFMALHFGRFLNSVIDTIEKRKAYDAIIEYLDNVDFYLLPELSEFMKGAFSVNAKIDIEKFEAGLNAQMHMAMTEPENYLDNNREFIEAYLKYKDTDEYKKSPAGVFQKQMIDFQKKSGYQDILVEGLKTLSPSYAEYMKEMEKANIKMIEKYPQAMNWKKNSVMR